ncbi:MAG TPA: hypothetical protein PLQ69_02635 [Paludibacter sp.]|nr:hypothetical protein [Paludibacter sp.]HPM09740.1 hypothetical protein [Paludibacter sp.]
MKELSQNNFEAVFLDIYIAPSGQAPMFAIMCALKGQNLSAQSNALGLMMTSKY